ncbi:epidermis-specific secreted glycoprotein EP1-like [Populus alba x Populus x berolinensis]|uniref:Epidermis-specific secreted glycoprotein EP1-like n=1 Tax=Populus alba x Populus x berolinensis TaxID=444605 RepID=A0AAD6Q5H3_9ROSI|nr:epidermis-specific secreted glycoprotein EP1-like [Populus alba x Populus x berolinensis]
MERSWFFSLLLLFSIYNLAQSTVPPSSRFKEVNTGDFAEALSEYSSDFRALDLSVSIFQLCFYNTTPNAFTFAIRMGTRRSPAMRRFVWEANRGNPVGEDATLTFGEDGNLILADADGRVAWQTNTANKGVVGLQMLTNGNMVLHDSKGNFIWQSFDYPTDTLLVGQPLRVGGVTRLVSRASDKQNTNGARTLLSRPKFNSTMSFLRLGVDGNLRVFTFNDKLTSASWEVTFTLFSRDARIWESECQLPQKCG